MAEDDPTRAARKSERAGWILAALFLAVSLPWLGSVAHYHGDERFYTDAALRMLESGDWLRPVYADGEPRLNKPLLTYWVLASTFGTAGISLFLARLPFLVAGALVIGLSGRLARVLFPEQPRVPFLAALIVACDVELSTLARRSTPDVLVVLCATASLYGLARIVVAGERGAAPRAWFWIGAGLSIATKGGWGILSAVFGVAAVLVSRRGGRPGRDLVHVPSVLAALAIAGVGLAGLFVARGSADASSLFQDQVGARLAASPTQVLAQASNYAASVLKHFLPWVACLALGFALDRGALARLGRQHRAACALALGWTALLLVVFAVSNTHRGRYLAPAHPLLAGLVALSLVELARSERAGRVLRALANGLTALVALLLVLVGMVLLRLDVPVALATIAAGGAAGIAWKRARHAPDEQPFSALALALVPLAPLVAEGLRARLDPSPVPAATARWLAAGLDHESRIATLGFQEAHATPSTASQVRMVSEGLLDPVEGHFPKNGTELAGFDAVLAPDAGRARLEAAGFTVEACGRQAPDLALSEVWTLLGASDPQAWLAERGPRIWLGWRRAGGSSK